jgi:hypothetical protein
MNIYYIVELVKSKSDNIELLGKFQSLNDAYIYIEKYSYEYKYHLIMEYLHLSDDQSKGSIISINNIKKPSKFIYIRSENNKKNKNLC